MSVKVFGDHPLTGLILRDALEYAADNGADVISMSLGGSYTDSDMEAGCEYAWEKGCLLVGASGNNRQIEDIIVYPAEYEEVIAVGAVLQDDMRARNEKWKSSYGKELELVAPSVVTTTVNGGGYRTDFSGTSAACPHVSGVAALVWSANPRLSNYQVRSILTSTCDDLQYERLNPPGHHPAWWENATPGWDLYTGFGRVNAYEAVKKAESMRIHFWDDFEDGNIDDWNVEVDDPPNTFAPSDERYFFNEYTLYFNKPESGAPPKGGEESKNETPKENESGKNLGSAQGRCWGETPIIDYDCDYGSYYTISFYFYLPHDNNHWFTVLYNKHINLVIDFDSELKVFDGPENLEYLRELNTEQWYFIECKAYSRHPNGGDFEIWIDREYEGKYDFKINSGRTRLAFGGVVDDDENYGEAYWDHIKLVQPCRWFEDFNDGDLDAWDVNGIFDISDQNFVSPPYSVMMEGESGAKRKNWDIPYDPGKPYEISFYFYLDDDINYWYNVICNGPITMWMNWDNILMVWDGDITVPVMPLEQGRWYFIECRMRRDEETWGQGRFFEVFIDNSYIDRYWMRHVDIHSLEIGAYSQFGLGKAYWDDIEINKWSDDFDDGNIYDWYCDLGFDVSDEQSISGDYSVKVEKIPGMWCTGTTSLIDYDQSRDYSISLYFYLEDEPNGYIYLLHNYKIKIVVNDDTLQVGVYSPEIIIPTLNRCQWYLIECKAHPDLDTFDVYIDHTYKGTYDFTPLPIFERLKFGCESSEDWYGVLYWDEIDIDTT